MQIALVRHGKPDHPGATRATPAEMRQWVEEYQLADVDLAPVPAPLAALVRDSEALVASSLLRCRQSAQHLYGDRPFTQDDVFTEAHQPWFALPFPRLPVPWWRFILRLAWFCGLSTHTESVAVSYRRAGRAAEQLIALAQQHGSVMLMGHGIMNVLIARQLQKRGWRGPKHLILKDFWEPSVYRL